MSVTQKQFTYQAGEHILTADVFLPDPAAYPGPRPGVIFYFGGGFVIGSRTQFHPQAEALAERGCVVFTPDYRVGERQGVLPIDCINDGLTFWATVREKAEEFSLDVTRVAFSGGSAGGVIAYMNAAQSECPPKALVLFNPAVTLHPNALLQPFRPGALMPAGEDLSRYLKAGMPPMLILHGQADQAVPVSGIYSFCQKAQALGIEVELHTYLRQQHGFFNKRPAAFSGEISDRHYRLTLQAMIDFLDSVL